MTAPNVRISATIERMASAADKIAAELHEYANAVADTTALPQILADEHAGPAMVVQIMREVDQRTRRPDDDEFRRVLMDVFGAMQAGREGDA